MNTVPVSALDAVRAVYDGAEGELWELLMGQQIHIGGLKATLELAGRAGLGARQRGIDLCCCNGAGMRSLVRYCGVAAMTGVDATTTVIERGIARCAAEGFAERIAFVHADACASGLSSESADFVWGEDAWCYVDDKGRLIAEAARLVRPGGTVAFSDWVAGPTPLDGAELTRVLTFMKFPNIASIPKYRALLEGAGCTVAVAEDSGRFARYVELYLDMVEMQLTADALRILDYDMAALDAVGREMHFLRDLARAGKIIQGTFIAQRN